jgi:ABC-type dipeptide/oligopeptide/nickel transport system permease subunit
MLMAAVLGSRPRPSRSRPRASLGTVGMTSLVVLVMIVLAVALGPFVWTVDPDQTDVTNRFASVSLEHPLGTDDYGRDILSRILHGGRLSLSGSLIILLGTSAIGLAVGALAGMLGGRVDMLLSRLIDALLSLPTLVVAFALAGALGKSFTNVLISLVVTGWPWYARAYRGLFMLERRREYVEAARVIGVPTRTIILRHVAPNVAGPVLVLMTVNLATAILNLTSLSFLGLGVQPPQAEWGAMVNYGRTYFQSEPWIILVPGLVIAITVLVINLLGDALRDMLDPRYVSAAASRRAAS